MPLEFEPQSGRQHALRKSCRILAPGGIHICVAQQLQTRANRRELRVIQDVVRFDTGPEHAPLAVSQRKPLVQRDIDVVPGRLAQDSETSISEGARRRQRECRGVEVRVKVLLELVRIADGLAARPDRIGAAKRSNSR